MAGPRLRETSNSPSKSGYGSAWIEKGTVVDVDVRNWTVDVVSEYSSKFWEKLQIASPYFHTHSGEGIFALPEPGSICLVCQPSDEDTPYVLAFLGSIELEYAKTDNLEDRAGEAEVETEELDLPTPKTGSSTAAGQSTSTASSRGGRPVLNPGDIMIQTRDQNFLVLRRGGVVQIGATPICQSVWIPINNFLRQFAENYELSTPGGMLYWNVQRQENDPGGEAPVLYRLALRDKAQNDKADIQLKLGHVDDSIRYELEVAPKGIKVADGTVSSSKLKLTIDKNGSQILTLSGSLTESIAQNRSVTVGGTDSLEVTGSQSIKAASQSTQITGNHELNATISQETLKGSKVIKAPQVMIGNAPVPTVVGPQLLIWLATHTHAAPGAPPTEAGALSSILSQTVKISP